MNEQIQTIIDRARVLLADATPGPLAVGVGEVETEDAGRHRAVLIHTDAYCVAACGSPGEPHSHADAEALAFAVNNIGTLCDALVDAERRAAETDAQAAVWREHTSALVAAMNTWGSWEDGVPDASDAGECGDVGRAFNAARDGLAPGMDLKAWRCSSCGETAASMTSAWRWNGSVWQHTHADAPQAGHFDAVYVDPAHALLDRLHAAETRVADLESVREEQAAKLRRHLDEIAELQERAGIAEGREAAAKANAAEMAGRLDAQNAGLVQMARDRDSALAEVEALKVERDVADRECDRLRAQVDTDRQELTRMAEKVARLEGRAVKGCMTCHGSGKRDCRGRRAGATWTPGTMCLVCGGAGAVIVEGVAQEGGAK